jgi:hypothetical protein
MSTAWTRLHLRLWDTTGRRLGRVSVVAGAVTTTGMFDQKSELVLDDQVVSVENALTVKTSELGGLRYGDLITVDGASYRVRQEPMRMGDGLLCVMPLERVENVDSISLIMADTLISSTTIIMAGA